MIWPVVLPTVAGVGATAVLVALTFRPSRPLGWRELTLPDELSAAQVVALLRHIAGVRHGPVCVAVRAERGRLRFMIGAPEVGLKSVVAAASGLIPEARFSDPLPEGGFSHGSGRVVGARVRWSGPWPLLKATSPELTVAALLGVLASAGPTSQAELRVRLWTARRVNRPVGVSRGTHQAPTPWLLRWWWPAEPVREDVAAIRGKYSDLLLDGEVLVGVAARTRDQANGLLHRLIAGLRTAGGSRGVLNYRLQSGRNVQRWFQRRRAPLPWEPHTLFSPAELAGICGLPIEAPPIPGVTYGAGPLLMPPLDLPNTGRVFGRSNFPATTGRRLRQPPVGALQHTLVTGPTGSGKSTLIANLVRDDIRAGRGCLVLDLKGDLVEDCLSFVPRKRLRDVVVLEPGQGGAQPGLRLFPIGGEPELTAELVLSILHELFRDSWGIRSSQYLGLGLKTLAAVRGATLTELPLLFTDARFRGRALKQLDDPWLQAAWQRFLGLSPADRAQQLSSPLTKIEELVSRGRLRLVLGQADSKLDFRDVLARGRIVFISLPPGLLGMSAVRLLAALSLWTFFQAVEGRAALPREQRSPFQVYVDEVAVLGALPLPLDAILERARGHGVGLSLSPQALSQLEPELRKALLANVGTVASFRQTSDEEAKAISKALPGVSDSQLQHLGPYEIALRLSLGPGQLTPTMTALTPTPEAAISEPAEVRAVAAERWGQTLEAVDAQLRARHNLPGPDPEQPDADPDFGVRRRRP